MKLKILFMSANPSKNLNIDEEIRNVTEAIQSYARHESVEMIYRPATRLKDMINVLNSEQPHILHFAGHGYDGSGELYMIDDDTKGVKIIPYEALSLLFNTVKESNLKLVFLNSCYSKVQADAILESIDYVIGMNDAIGDNAAKTLSTQFYSSFVSGVSLVNSFNQAKSLISANHFSQKNIPELLRRNKRIKDFSIVDIIGEEEEKTTQEEKNSNITVNGDVNGVVHVSGGTVNQTINKKVINAKTNIEKLENKDGGVINF